MMHHGKKEVNDLCALRKLLQAWILEMTTRAGSGHPTSSLSALDAMLVLFFGRDARGGAFFHYDVAAPEDDANDRLIFSKGHAAPLYYALWAAAEVLSEEELMTLRRFDSALEGHPTRRFALTEVPTGSLGQGLSAGLGEALALRARHSAARVTVLLGDSEMAEGQVWEAMQLAAYYAADTLMAVVDVNRLGQRGATMVGHDVDAYAARAEAFGWHAIVVDGHDHTALAAAYAEARVTRDVPTMIFARTQKGHGVSFLADQEGWHGKALSEEELVRALAEIGAVDRAVRGTVALPLLRTMYTPVARTPTMPTYARAAAVAPRVAYGAALAALARADARVVALDAETSNSTKADAVKRAAPAQFYEMYIAEQNMASVAVGMARRGLRPFVSTFAAFLTRAADQIRMAQYAGVDVTFAGSHAGISIGADGASQMGLEDLALFSALRESTILYPADAVSTAACVALLRDVRGISYVRTTRAAVPVLYDAGTTFAIGASRILRQSAQDVVTICAAGITVHEALRAADTLAADGIAVRVIDCYSVRPLDVTTVRAAARDTARVVVVEDHYESGGLGAAVRTVLCGEAVRMTHLCVRKAPRSGAPAELLAYAEIDAAAIMRAVRAMV